MTKDEWDILCLDAAEKMIEHIKPFLTPVSIVVSEEEGKLLGSGSYIEVKEEKYLISNEHVLEEMAIKTLAHQFNESDEIILLKKPYSSKSLPIDVAITKIKNKAWDSYEHEAKAIPIERFSLKHEPIEHEALFFAGHSGEKSKFLFNNLFTTGTPYLTQECEFPSSVDNADSNFHFSLFYLPDLAKSLDGKTSLPNPHGFSGSLVWDTKLVYCYQNGITWSPELAKVTGIVWGWPSSSGSILATKVEYINFNQLLKKLKKA